MKYIAGFEYTDDEWDTMDKTARRKVSEVILDLLLSPTYRIPNASYRNTISALILSAHSAGSQWCVSINASVTAASNSWTGVNLRMPKRYT